MTTIINAVSGNGLTQTVDGSGIIKVQSNGSTTNALAWINFNGVTTISINSQYNISSVTRNSTGDYTLNFANALTDSNYAVAGSIVNNNASDGWCVKSSGTSSAPTLKTTTQLEVISSSTSGTLVDDISFSIIIFGN